jgi:hypothetical protein
MSDAQDVMEVIDRVETLGLHEQVTHPVCSCDGSCVDDQSSTLLVVVGPGAAGVRPQWLATSEHSTQKEAQRKEGDTGGGGGGGSLSLGSRGNRMKFAKATSLRRRDRTRSRRIAVSPTLHFPHSTCMTDGWAIRVIRVELSRATLP